MKFYITVGVLVALIIGILTFGLIKQSELKKERIAHESTLATLSELQAQSFATENTVNIFRVSESVDSGTMFNPALVEVVPIPESMLNDGYVIAPDDLQGAIWRIPLHKNSIITYDMLAYHPIHPSDRMHVVQVDNHTPSLTTGSFVDIRILTPEGIDFVVLPRMRVINIYSSGLEVILSETQWMIYIGALIDRSLNPGTVIYASMYVDAGLQPSLYSTYIPPRHIVEYMNVNRNMLFPYVDGTDIVDIRKFIESTFPRNLYAHTLFSNPESAIRDREQRIISAMLGQSSATLNSRREYIEYMRNLAAQNGGVWEGDRSAAPQIGAPGVQGGATGQGEQNNNPNSVTPNNTWVDDKGIERNPDGSPVIQIGDLFDTGSQPVISEAPITGSN